MINRMDRHKISGRVIDRILLFGLAFAIVMLMSPFVYYALGHPCPPCKYWGYDPQTGRTGCVGGCSQCESVCIDDDCAQCGGDSNKYCCDDLAHCCPYGKGCCGGTCCEPGQSCCNGSCTSSCYKIKNVPASVDPPSCPDCAHFFSGCGDATQTVINGYSEFETAGPEESGFTKNPTKTDTVGYIFPCEEEWNIGQIISCAGEATICVDLCTGINSKVRAAACVACLVVAGIDCALDGVCVFVTDCLPSEEGAFPITREVIDGEGDLGCLCSNG